jgi:tetratricopeptide (TPR) repeat protein
MDAAEEVEEASEAMEELPLATEFPPASQAPSWMSSFPPPVVEPEVLAPGPTTAGGAGPMFTTPSVVPPSAGPPSFSPFTQMRPVPSETAVEEALVEAEIFRKYGLLDKAADQLRTLLAKYEESAKLREKLFEVLLEQGKKDAAREQADALTKIYSQEGREDRIRGLRALLGEPQPPSGVQEAPKPAVPQAFPSTSSEVQPPVEVAPPPGPRVVEEIEVPPSLFRPAETAPPLPAEPVGEVVMTAGDSGQAEAPPVALTEAPALPPPLPMGAPVAPPPFPVLQVPLPEFVTVAPPPMTEVVAAPIPDVEAATAEFPAPVAEAPAPVVDVPPAPVLPPHVQAPVAMPPVRPRLSSQDLAAALAMPQTSKPAVKKEKKPEFDALAQLGLTRGTLAAKSPTRDSGSRTTRLDLSELDAFAGFGKPKKAPPKVEIPAVAEALPVPSEPSLPPILPPPAVEQEIEAQVSPETILEEPVLTPEPLAEFSPESEMLAPDLPVALPSGPSPEELSEIDFCLEQGMVVDAAERLQTLESRFPGHPEVASRRQRLEGGSTEDAKKALNEIFSEDLEMVLDAELGKALTDEMAKGAAEATPGPESPSVQVDESGLFSDEQDFFNFAEELQTEMKQESIVEKAAGPQQEVSLEEIFREFKKGVEQQLSPEDYETHYNLGIAYKEMGLTDEAIGEFQIASKDAAHSVECCSMLGLCFLEKSLPQLAIKWYRKGLETPGIRENDKLGLQYDLASVYANVGDSDNAYKTFLEIYGTDASFRDVADRVKEYETQAN